MSVGTPDKAARTLRVLVADDDPIQRSLIAARLSQFHGEAVEAEDGAEAWRLLIVQEFDLAIVDLGMPNLDGISLIQCMRGHPRTRHLPVIVVTSRTDRDTIEEAFAAGASSFLTKPVVWSTFEHHVGFLLRLVDAANAARTAGQRSLASDRAKAAIVGRLCGDTTTAASTILSDVEHLALMAASSKLAPAFLDGLRRVAEACHALQDGARMASTAVDVLSQKIAVDSRRTPLAEIIDPALDAVARSAWTARVTVDCQLPSGSPPIACDAEAIELALVHLLRNAVKHSAPGSVVTVRSELYPDGLLALEVEDSGAGMHPDTLVQCLAGSKDAPGVVPAAPMGFGLLLAKAVAEAHGGSLELRSAPGQGTKAVLILPPDRVGTAAEAA